MKTYTINLSGKIFNIDEMGLAELQKYIDTLKAHYSHEAGGDEIMEDIERRVAELFLEYQKQEHRNVVTRADVAKVITVMGSPDAIFETDEPRATRTPPRTGEASVPAKKLFRDADDRVFGGVASGIAHYLDVSPLLVRVCFILMMLFYGIFFIIYALMWMLVPKAITAKQKLKMKGKSINVSDIENSVRGSNQEANERSKTPRKPHGCLYNGLKVAAIVICVHILITLLANIFHVSHAFIYNNYIASFLTPTTHFIGWKLGTLEILIGLLVFTPIFLVVYLLLQTVRSTPGNKQEVIKTVTVIWLAIFITFILALLLP